MNETIKMVISFWPLVYMCYRYSKRLPNPPRIFKFIHKAVDSMVAIANLLVFKPLTFFMLFIID